MQIQTSQSVWNVNHVIKRPASRSLAVWPHNVRSTSSTHRERLQQLNDNHRRSIGGNRKNTLINWSEVQLRYDSYGRQAETATRTFPLNIFPGTYFTSDISIPHPGQFRLPCYGVGHFRLPPPAAADLQYKAIYR